MMTSKERVLASARRTQIDRPATGLRCTPEAWEKLRGLLNVKTNHDVLDLLDIDLRWVGVPFIGPKEKSAIPLMSEGTDFWGCHTRKVVTDYNTYFEFDYHPLAEAKTVGDILAHDWPSLDWWDYSSIIKNIEQENRKEPRAIMYFAGGAFETPWYIRGMEKFMTDLYENPEIVEAICAKVEEFYRLRALRVLESAKGRIDIIGSGGDIGTQRGMMIHPNIWRERIKPFTGRLISTFKNMGLATFYHSCGSLVPVIDDLIECGLDILDPIQVTAEGMTPEQIFPKFGKRLSFHGAIDEVNLLPHASAEEVRKETTRIINILGKNNGFIVAPSHMVQGDTPPENVVAIYEAVKSYSHISVA
jgi:uroporphyrinogen decarboxylase